MQLRRIDLKETTAGDMLVDVKPNSIFEVEATTCQLSKKLLLQKAQAEVAPEEKKVWVSVEGNFCKAGDADGFIQWGGLNY